MFYDIMYVTQIDGVTRDACKKTLKIARFAENAADNDKNLSAPQAKEVTHGVVKKRLGQVPA